MPRARAGQHFLADPSVAERIVAAARAEGETVLEIGPGRGALTGLLCERARRVVAVELDPRLAADLERTAPPNLAVLRDDARTVSPRALRAAGGFGDADAFVVVANLPYYAATPILFRLFRFEIPWRRAVVMLQHEVAARLAAPPGSRTYGRLSVAAQCAVEVSYLFPVPSGAFRPRPRVASAVVALSPRRARPAPEVFAALEALTARAFSRRRKTLANALGAGLVRRLGLGPAARAARPEAIPPGDYLRWAEAIAGVVE